MKNLQGRLKPVIGVLGLMLASSVTDVVWTATPAAAALQPICSVQWVEPDFAQASCTNGRRDHRYQLIAFCDDIPADGLVDHVATSEWKPTTEPVSVRCPAGSVGAFASLRIDGSPRDVGGPRLSLDVSPDVRGKETSI